VLDFLGAHLRIVFRFDACRDSGLVPGIECLRQAFHHFRMLRGHVDEVQWITTVVIEFVLGQILGIFNVVDQLPAIFDDAEARASQVVFECDRGDGSFLGEFIFPAWLPRSRCSPVIVESLFPRHFFEKDV